MNTQGIRPIRFGPIGAEIDKKDLLAVVRRFQNLHQVQLRQIQESLSARQRDFLDLLPLLFHVNYPLLPGFVTTETPAGIAGYAPGKATLQAASRISKSFDFRKRPQKDYPIQALFLMGSVGSIAYSKKSDLDIWLCHQPGLESAALEELRRKAWAIESWASTLGLEAHIFLIDPVAFREGVGEPISTESCGSIQHHLLLEEFYRTSLHMAGRIPAWWLVPAEQESRYTVYLEHLCHRRFVDFADIIDFGGLEGISSTEFLGGTLWHLYKAITSPHKSLLKLLLMESYASEFPNPDWLCTRLKASIHAGSLDLPELDSYVLIYRKVETYLTQRGEADRLELARQCFYLKVNESMSQPGPEKHYRRETLQAMLDEWGWSDASVQELDGRKRRRVRQVLEEQGRIARELTQSYQAVNRFAHDHGVDRGSPVSELMLLGRRLHAALERKPGKVELVGNEGDVHLEREDFSLHEIRFADGDNGWALHAGIVKSDQADKPEALQKTRSLLEIMAWLVLNRFYDKTAGIHLSTTSSLLTVAEFRASVDALAAFAEKHRRPAENLSAYEAPSRIETCIVFVNVGLEPETERKDGLQITSNRFDALSFGANRVNLVQSVDRVSFTSWQEVTVSRHQGLEGLFDCLCEILNQSGTRKELQSLECVGFSSVRSRGIAARVQEVYQNLHNAFCSPEVTRYVIRGGGSLFVFENRDGILAYEHLSDETRLAAELGKPLRRFGQVAFDPAALDTSPLPTVYQQNRDGLIQIFLQPGPEQTEVFILDEKGSLFHRVHPQAEPQHLLGTYVLFVAAIQQRYATAVRGAQYFRIDGKRGSGHEVAELTYKPMPVTKKLNIRVSGQIRSAGKTAFSIYCNEREFTSRDSGEDVFSQVARYIAGIRQGGERYPIYITDIDVPPTVLGVDSVEQLQTLHFLQYKQKVENRLNKDELLISRRS